MSNEIIYNLNEVLVIYGIIVQLLAAISFTNYLRVDAYTLFRYSQMAFGANFGQYKEYVKQKYSNALGIILILFGMSMQIVSLSITEIKIKALYALLGLIIVIIVYIILRLKIKKKINTDSANIKLYCLIGEYFGKKSNKNTEEEESIIVAKKILEIIKGNSISLGNRDKLNNIDNIVKADEFLKKVAKKLNIPESAIQSLISENRWPPL